MEQGCLPVSTEAQTDRRVKKCENQKEEDSTEEMKKEKTYLPKRFWSINST